MDRFRQPVAAFLVLMAHHLLLHHYGVSYTNVQRLPLLRFLLVFNTPNPTRVYYVISYKQTNDYLVIT